MFHVHKEIEYVQPAQHGDACYVVRVDDEYYGTREFWYESGQEANAFGAILDELAGFAKLEIRSILRDVQEVTGV